MTTEQTPFPDTIAGAELIDAERIPSRPGELPELAVLMGRESGRPKDRAYAVWSGAVRDGKWTAFQGNYDLSRDDARKEYHRRLSLR